MLQGTMSTQQEIDAEVADVEYALRAGAGRR